MTSYLPVAKTIENMQTKGYQKVICGGFSAGCDMLLRAVTFTPAHCDMLMLQSPWVPVLQDHAEAVVQAVKKKNIALRIFCGSDDKDCLPLATQLYDATKKAEIDVKFNIQENSRHQFPSKMYTLEEVI